MPLRPKTAIEGAVSLAAFALDAWRRPGVEAACLALQDEHGQCAPLLLWRLWAFAGQRRVDDPVLAAAVGIAKGWDSAAVTMLRAVRRRLKIPFPPIPDAARLALGDEVAKAELAAERILMGGLEALTPTATAPNGDRLAALVDVARAWGAPAPEGALQRLLIATL